MISLDFAVSDSTDSLVRSQGRFDHDAPARHAVGVKADGDERRARAFRQKRRQRSCRCKFSEERRPQTLIARVLVAQNADHAAATQQLDRFLKTFFAIEHFDAGAAAQFSHMFIDQAIAEFLIDRAIAGVVDERRKNLRESSQLPR